LSIKYNRESNLIKIHNNLIEPFFKTGEIGYFKGINYNNKQMILRYIQFLQKNESKGNIIIVHGFGERIEKYKELCFDLYNFGMNVFIYDQRGYGLSKFRKDGLDTIDVDRFRYYSDDLHSFITNIVSEKGNDLPLFIFSHSMGSAVTIRMIINHQFQKICGLILSSPLLKVNTKKIPYAVFKGTTFLGKVPKLKSQMYFGEKKQNFEYYKDYKLCDQTNSEKRWEIYKNFMGTNDNFMLAPGGVTFHFAYELNSTLESIFRDKMTFDNLSIPSLVFQAGQDSKVDNRAQDAFFLKQKQTQLIRIQDGRHSLYMESDNIRSFYLERILNFITYCRENSRNYTTKQT